MIIGNALKTLFTGLKVDVINNGVPVNKRDVNFHWGDQKELLAWVHDRDNKKAAKYPLVWYVLNDYTEHNSIYDTEATLVIMQLNDNYSQLNTVRNANSYTGIIQPVWEAVEKRLLTNKHIEIYSNVPQKRFSQMDVPNYGVDVNNEGMKDSDFKGNATKSVKSIVTDIVDAKFVKFKMRIQAGCIKNNLTI